MHLYEPYDIRTYLREIDTMATPAWDGRVALGRVLRGGIKGEDSHQRDAA